MAEHDYCRTYLKEVMQAIVRKHASPETIKAAWGYLYSGGRTAEFQINKCPEVPDGFHWHGRACCLWMAKALGWEAFFKSLKE